MCVVYHLLISVYRYGIWQSSFGSQGSQFASGTPQNAYHQPVHQTPAFPERSFWSPPPLPPARTSPFPGSEEHMQRNIKETSDMIKKHLDLDLDNRDDLDAAGQVEDEVAEKPDTKFISDIFGKTMSDDDDDVDEPIHEHPKAEVPRTTTSRNKDFKVDTKYDVEEIRNKIIAHITNLSSGKKMNLINMGSESYDAAIHRIQKNERLTIIRALRDACSDQPTEASSILNSIIPDMDIKIEELPADKREELSTSLKIYDDKMFDPHVYFQQAKEMLSETPDDFYPGVDDVNVGQTDTNFTNINLSPLNTELLPKNPIDEADNNLDTWIEPLGNPAAETLKMRELLNEPVITSDMHFRKKTVLEIPENIMSSPVETSLIKQRTLEESYKQFEAEISSSAIRNIQTGFSPSESERFLNDSGRFKTKSVDENVSTLTEEPLLPVDFNFTSSYLNFKNSTGENMNRESDKKTETKVRDKHSSKIEEQNRKHSSPILYKDKKDGISVVKSEYEKPKMSLDERIAKELRDTTSHKEKIKEYHRKRNEPSPTRRTKTLVLEDSTTTQSKTSSQTSDNFNDFSQLKSSQKVTETSELRPKTIWRSPGEKKFMAEQKHRVSVYENSDTELDFSGPDTDDENKSIFDNSFSSNIDNELKIKSDPVNKNKHTESTDQMSVLNAVNLPCKIETSSNTQKTNSKRDPEPPRLEKAILEERKQADKQRSSDTTKNIDISEAESMKRSETKRSSSHHGNKHHRKRSMERDVYNSKYFLQNEANAALHSVGAKNVDVSNSTTPLQQDDFRKGSSSSSSKPDYQKNNHTSKKDHTVKKEKREKSISKSPIDMHDYDKKVEDELDKCNPVEAESAQKITAESTTIEKPAAKDGTKATSSRKDKSKTHIFTSRADSNKNSEVKAEKLVEDAAIIKQESECSTLSVRHEKSHSVATLETKTLEKVTNNDECKSEDLTSKVTDEVSKHTSNKKRGRQRNSRSSNRDTKQHSDESTETSEIKDNIASFRPNNENATTETQSVNTEMLEKRDDSKVSEKTIEALDAKNEDTTVNSNIVSERTKVNDLSKITSTVPTAKVDIQEALEKSPIKMENSDSKLNEETPCVKPESENTKINHPRRGRPRKSRSKSDNKDSEETTDDQNKNVSAINVVANSDTIEVSDVKKRKRRKLHTVSIELDQNREIQSEKAKETVADARQTSSKEKDSLVSELSIEYAESTTKGSEEGKSVDEKPNVESTITTDTEIVKKDDFAQLESKGTTDNTANTKIVKKNDSAHLESERTADNTTNKVERETSSSSMRELSEQVKTDSIEKPNMRKVDTPSINANVKEGNDVSENETKNKVLENITETEIVNVKTSTKVEHTKRGRPKNPVKNKRGKTKKYKETPKLDEDAISVAAENVHTVQNTQIALSTREDAKCCTQETNIKTAKEEEVLPTEKPECLQRKTKNTKASSPEKQETSTDKSHIKDEEKSETNSEVNTGDATFIKPSIVRDEETSSKRRSSRIKRSSKAENEVINNKTEEVAATCEVKNELEIPVPTKRRKSVARKYSRDAAETQTSESEISVQEQPSEVEENIQTQRIRSKRSPRKHDPIEGADMMETSNLALNSIETLPSTDLSLTEARKEKRKSKTKKTKKPKRQKLQRPKSIERVEIKTEPSDTIIENTVVELEVPTRIDNIDVEPGVPASSSFEENTISEISPRKISLRLKCLSTLLEHPTSQDRSETSSSQNVVEQAAKKQKQNLRKRKLSDNEVSSPDKKKQKTVTKRSDSETYFNDAASQTNIPCTSCVSYRQDMERKKQWIDELRKIDDTIKGLLHAKAELYEKLITGEEPSRRVARKSTASTKNKSTARSKSKKVPCEVVSSDTINIKRESTESQENNSVRYIPKPTARNDSKFSLPCFVRLPRYNDEHFDRIKRENRSYEENRPNQCTEELNVISTTEADGVSNLRIVSVTSLAIEPEIVPTTVPLETRDKVLETETAREVSAQTVTLLNEQDLTTIFAATIQSAVLVLKVSIQSFVGVLN